MKKILLLLAMATTLTSCFDNANTNNNSLASSGSNNESEITSADFQGATAAINKVTGVEIQWTASNKTASAYRVYRTAGKNLNLIAAVTGDVTSYIDGTIFWGSIYSYVVRAVDSKGVEETNTKQVSTLFWAGISSIESDSRSSLKIQFDYPTPIVDEIRIYIQAADGSDEKTLKKTVLGSETEVTLEGLRPGYSYKVSAQGYVSSLKKEDGNPVTIEATTKTYSYHSDDNSSAGWNNIMNIRAFGESPGSPEHPTIAGKSPQSRIVELAFNSFNAAPENTSYLVIRAQDGQKINTSTTTTCTESTIESCKVGCTVAGTGVLICKDELIGASPAKYRYTLALSHHDGNESWVEPLPQDKVENYSVLVPIPPRDMVLVQRDAANYEMCLSTMNKTPDPENHNRCVYNGLGATPYSSGHNKPALNLEDGYFDFGYNLFMDRYPLGCNWTPASAGGRCGDNQTSGDCFRFGSDFNLNPNTAPGAPFGEDGQVLYTIGSTTSARCWVNEQGTWRHLTQVQRFSNDPIEAYKKMVTSNPSSPAGKLPIFYNHELNPTSSNMVCNSQVDPNYGPKRIPRMREYRIFNTFPIIPNEPYYIPYATARNYMDGGDHNATEGYRCGQSINEPLPTNDGSEVSVISSILAPNNEIVSSMYGAARYGIVDYFLGSISNIDCQNRYGANNLTGFNVVSDYFVKTYDGGSVYKLVGSQSPIDDGNRDLNYSADGSTTTYTIDVTKTSFNSSSSFYYTYLSSPDPENNKYYVAAPLGMPIFLSSSQDYLSASVFALKGYNSFQNLGNTNPETEAVTTLVNRRWETSFRRKWNDWGANIIGLVRCVLPAE